MPFNGTVNSTAGTFLADVAIYYCDTGFDLVGNTTSICQASGMWSSSPPSCDIVDCSDPEKPRDGAVDTSNGTTFGETVLYSCHSGYEINGTRQRQCLQTGNWSTPEPVCQRVGEYHSSSHLFVIIISKNAVHFLE